MNYNANDLRIESRAANNVDNTRANFIALNPAAMIAAARTEQSKEIARLVLTGGRAIANLISKFTWKAIKETLGYNQAVSELEAMDDWALQDIGVLRSMISHAVRGQIVNKEYSFDVTAPVDQASVENVTSSLPANCNKIGKHHHAA